MFDPSPDKLIPIQVLDSARSNLRIPIGCVPHVVTDWASQQVVQLRLGLVFHEDTSTVICFGGGAFWELQRWNKALLGAQWWDSAVVSYTLGGAVSLISGKKYQQYITYITILVGVISQLMEVTIIVIPCYTHVIPKRSFLGWLFHQLLRICNRGLGQRRHLHPRLVVISNTSKQTCLVGGFNPSEKY